VLAAIRDALGAQSEAGARVAAAGASLEEVARLLSAYGVGRAFVDLGVARGLDYYTGMVFEIEIPELGAEKQVVGGGAYALAELFGGENVGSVGFGMGFDRILLALEKLGVPLPSESGLLATVVPIGDALRGAAIALATELRQSRLRTDVELARRKPAKALEWANARGIPFVILLGEKEAAQGAVTVRSMTTGEQVLVPRKEIVSHMAHLARILRESKSHADARSRPR
jgi:histidyl-tRNA synthetase